MTQPNVAERAAFYDNMAIRPLHPHPHPQPEPEAEWPATNLQSSGSDGSSISGRAPSRYLPGFDKRKWANWNASTPVEQRAYLTKIEKQLAKTTSPTEQQTLQSKIDIVTPLVKQAEAAAAEKRRKELAKKAAWQRSANQVAYKR